MVTRFRDNSLRIDGLDTENITFILDHPPTSREQTINTSTLSKYPHRLAGLPLELESMDKVTLYSNDKFAYDKNECLNPHVKTLFQ